VSSAPLGVIHTSPVPIFARSKTDTILLVDKKYAGAGRGRGGLSATSVVSTRSDAFVDVSNIAVVRRRAVAPELTDARRRADASEGSSILQRRCK
jgi:hypothetical protein